MTRFVMALLCAAWALVGCGGDIEIGYGPEPETVAQDVTVPDKDYGWLSGLSYGSGNPRCTTISNGQTCNFPSSKSPTVKGGSGWSASQLTSLNALIDGNILRFDEDIDDGGFAVTRTTGSNPKMVIDNVDANPATNKNSIHTYVHAFPTTATPLSESTDIPGAYQKVENYRCEIDRNNIVRDFTVAEQDKVLSHAVDYCLAKLWGEGSSGVSTTRPYAIAVTPAAYKSDTISSRVSCELQNYDPSGTTYGPLFCLSLADCPCMNHTNN